MGFLASMLGFGATSADPAVDERLWRELYPETWSGNRVNADTAMRISVVYAAVNLYAKIIAALPKGIYLVDEKGDETPQRDHPLWDLLEHTPNNWQTAFEFWSYCQSCLSLRGNGLAEIIPGARGAVDQLEPVHPDRVLKIERMADRTLMYTIRDEEGGGSRKLHQEEVLHVRSPTTDRKGVWGVAPVELARQTFGLTLAAEEHGSRTFAQGARPSGAVVLPGTMSDVAYDRFKAQIESQHVGLRNSGKTLILEGGAKFEPISMTAEQLQFLSTRQFQIEEIARWFDVPLVMLHHLTNNTSWGTGIETVLLAFIKNSLRPWTTAWEQAMFRDLVVNKRRYRIRFDLTDLMKGDSNALSNFINKLVLGGVLTRNEGRRMINRPSLPGLDEPLTPSNTNQSDQQPDNGNQNKDTKQ